MNQKNEIKTTLPAVIQSALELQKININEVNLILPTETYGQFIGEFDKVTIGIVRVDPDPAHKEVYEISKGKLSLCKRPLAKMAVAVGIVWDPKTTGIVESTKRKSRAKATGAIKRDNVDWLPCTEEKTVDLDAIQEEQTIKQEEYAEEGFIIEWKTSQKGKRYPVYETWAKHGGEKAKRAQIELEVRKAVLGYWKFKDERANTGAKERVIKFFLALKDTYTPAELSKPIAFPCISTDAKKLLADPRMSQKAIEKMTGSTVDLFGPQQKQTEIESKPSYQVIDNESEEETEEEPAEKQSEDKSKEVHIPWPGETEEEKQLQEMIEELQIRRKKFDDILPKEAKEMLDDILSRKKQDPKTISSLIDQFDDWEETARKKGAIE